MLAILNGLIDLLTGSAWTYPLLFGICLGDAVFPVLPSETAAIVCGIQAARGQLSLGWVLVLAAPRSPAIPLEQPTSRTTTTNNMLTLTRIDLIVFVLLFRGQQKKDVRLSSRGEPGVPVAWLG